MQGRNRPLRPYIPASAGSYPRLQSHYSFLRLNKAIATSGFTVKRGTWNSTNAEVYQFNYYFLEKFPWHG